MSSPSVTGTLSEVTLKLLIGVVVLVVPKAYTFGFYVLYERCQYKLIYKKEKPV